MSINNDDRVIVAKTGLQKILELYKELDTLVEKVNKEHASATSEEKQELIYNKLRHNNLWDRVGGVDEFRIDVEYNTPREKLVNGGLDTVIFTISTEFDEVVVFTEFEVYFEGEEDNIDLELERIQDVLERSKNFSAEFIALYE